MGTSTVSDAQDATDCTRDWDETMKETSGMRSSPGALHRGYCMQQPGSWCLDELNPVSVGILHHADYDPGTYFRPWYHDLVPGRLHHSKYFI